MKKQTYSLAKLFLLITAFAFVSACQETLVESKAASSSIINLSKESDSKTPDTYVHGYITKDDKPAKYASVKLLDSNGNQLTSTTANAVGYYIMEVCPYGFGFRTVKATYSGETGSNHFTFVYGTWDYTVHVAIGFNPDSNND